jgi:CHAD domain-containing protein
MLLSTPRDALLRKRLEQFTRMLQGLEKGDASALHRARVATRRLRELLPVLQLDHDASSKLTRRLRKVTQRLGSVRELDVLMQLVDELHGSDRHNAEALNRVAAIVDRNRKDARRRLFVKLPMAELHRLADKLGDVAQQLEPAGGTTKAARQSDARSWRWALDARVARRAARVNQAIDAAGALYLPERLHAVRITVKKLRYALEVASEARGTTPRAELALLKHAQDLLGRLHDLQVLIDRARQVQAALAPPNITTWRGLEALVDVLEDDCRRLHARYMHDRDALLALGGRHTGRARTTAARRVTA